MKTWKDVIKGFVCCLGVVIAGLFLVMALMWIMEKDIEIECMQTEIYRLQEAVKELKEKKLRLMPIDGAKYLTIFTKEKEVVIETTRGTR